MTNINVLLNQWTVATGKLKYGVQRVFHDVFVLASEEKTTLIHGADYRDGFPCLINTVGGMLTTGGGHGVPSTNFGEVVSLFDQINAHFDSNKINTTPGYVSPITAEILLKNFAPLKDAPPLNIYNEEPYNEPTDEDMAKAMVALFTADMPNEPAEIMNDADNEIAVSRIETQS